MQEARRSFLALPTFLLDCVLFSLFLLLHYNETHGLLARKGEKRERESNCCGEERKKDFDMLLYYYNIRCVLSTMPDNF